MEETTAKNQCPEFSFFGAAYPDARCIGGYLWDLDKYEDGQLYGGGEEPCPFCNPQAVYEQHKGCLDYSDQDEDGETDEMYEQRMDFRIRQNINSLREKHGFEAVIFND